MPSKFESYPWKAIVKSPEESIATLGDSPMVVPLDPEARVKVLP